MFNLQNVVFEECNKLHFLGLLGMQWRPINFPILNGHYNRTVAKGANGGATSPVKFEKLRDIRKLSLFIRTRGFKSSI